MVKTWLPVALAAGLAAYDRGDYFEAHELLEPAWIGTVDLAERAVLEGLIQRNAMSWRFVANILIAFLPSAILGFLLINKIEAYGIARPRKR